eukprot:6486169-Amphidinium_carterae.1
MSLEPMLQCANWTCFCNEYENPVVALRRSLPATQLLSVLYTHKPLRYLAAQLVTRLGNAVDIWGIETGKREHDESAPVLPEGKRRNELESTETFNKSRKERKRD